MKASVLALFALSTFTACSPFLEDDEQPFRFQAYGHVTSGAPHDQAAANARIDAELADVARIHGGTGPWAVAGYRMGLYARSQLNLPMQSFDIEVIHRSPNEVQYTCIADGASAATGASLGKMNLLHEEATLAGLETTYRNRKTGQSLTMRPSASFRARFTNVPREQLADAGRIVWQLPDPEVFEVVRR